MHSLPAPGHGQADPGDKPKPFSPADVISIVLGVIRRRWYLLLAGLACSAALSQILPKKFASYSYEARASLLHSNLPIPESQKVFYQAPDLKTVMSLFTDRNTLKRLKEQEKLEVPLKLLENSITAEVATGTKTIKVSFGWANADDAVRMLKETITIVGETLDEIRVEKLENHVRELEAEGAERDVWLKKAIRDLDEFHAKNEITDLDEDLERIQLQIAEKEQSLESAEREAADIKAQQERLTQYMAEIKSREEADAAEAKQFEAAAETVSDNRRRQDRLRELIYEERRLQEVQAKIVAKKSEYQRLDALRKKGFASASEVDAIKGELAALESQVNMSDRITAWEKELAEIDAVVVPKNSKKNVGSPIIQQTLFRELELSLSKLASDVQIRMIKEATDKSIKQKNRLIGLRIEYEDLKRKVSSAQEAERLAAERIHVLKSLARIRKTELVVLAEPESAPEGAKSNKKILMLAGLVGGFMPAAALAAGLEGLYWLRRSRSRKKFVPLPVLGVYLRTAEGEPAGHVPTRESRLLAMKIRKLYPHYGAMIAFAGLDERSRGMSSLISEIALSLSRRDERLMILDTRGIENGSDDLRKPKVHKHVDSPGPKSGSGSRTGSGTGSGSGSRALSVTNPMQDVSRVHRLPDMEDDERLNEGEDEEAGLSDYLGFLKLSLEEIKLPGPDYGIDVIPRGRLRLHAESLATHRMRDVVSELKSNYSMILVLTDGLCDSVALATMMEHVDGAIVVANESRPTEKAFANLSTLLQDYASIAGQIVIDTVDASN